MYQKIRTQHKSMLARCYNKKSSSYKMYGGEGVTVSERWINLDNFIEDIDKIEGFDLDLYMKSEIQLDKDIKQRGVDRKKYSLDTTIFVSSSENSGNRRNNKEMIIISPSGERFEEINREAFCRERGIPSRNAFNCLTGKANHYKGWQFFYKDSFDEKNVILMRRIKGISPTGEEFIFNNITIFAREKGLSAPNISMVLSKKNKHHKGWKFELLEDGWVSQEKIAA